MTVPPTVVKPVAVKAPPTAIVPLFVRVLAVIVRFPDASISSVSLVSATVIVLPVEVNVTLVPVIPFTPSTSSTVYPSTISLKETLFS